MKTTQFKLSCAKEGLWTIHILDTVFLEPRIDWREAAGQIIRCLDTDLPQNSQVVVIDLEACTQLNEGGLNCLLEVDVWLKSSSQAAIAIDLPPRNIAQPLHLSRLNLLLNRSKTRKQEIQWLVPSDRADSDKRLI